MAISRAQLLKELLPGLNALFGLEYAKYGEEHKEIYETETSERSFEEETKLSGFSAAPVKNEGSAIAYDNAQEAWTARYTHETIAMGFAITEEAITMLDQELDRVTNAIIERILEAGGEAAAEAHRAGKSQDTCITEGSNCVRRWSKHKRLTTVQKQTLVDCFKKAFICTSASGEPGVDAAILACLDASGKAATGTAELLAGLDDGCTESIILEGSAALATAKAKGMPFDSCLRAGETGVRLRCERDKLSDDQIVFFVKLFGSLFNSEPIT